MQQAPEATGRELRWRLAGVVVGSSPLSSEPSKAALEAGRFFGLDALLGAIAAMAKPKIPVRRGFGAMSAVDAPNAVEKRPWRPRCFE